MNSEVRSVSSVKREQCPKCGRAIGMKGRSGYERFVTHNVGAAVGDKRCAGSNQRVYP